MNTQLVEKKPHSFSIFFVEVISFITLLIKLRTSIEALNDFKKTIWKRVKCVLKSYASGEAGKCFKE